MRRYDNGHLGKIGFADYCHLITPVSKEYAKLITGRADFFSRKIGLDSREYFSADTRIELKNFWKILLQTERASECLRSRIAKRPNFSI
jgi:hypothetical protein